MATYGEVRDLIDRLEDVSAQVAPIREIVERVRTVMTAICGERGLRLEEVMKGKVEIAESTELGPAAQEKFNEFRAWAASRLEPAA